jgi:hypothetical protein
MAYTVNPNKEFRKTRVNTAHRRFKRRRAVALKVEQSGEISELSVAESAFAFFAWLIAFAAFGKGLLLAWAYFA